MKLPAFWSAIFFITGILAGRYLNLPDLWLFVMALVFFTAGIVIYFSSKISYAWIVVAGALFMAGVFRVGLESGEPASNHISHFNDLGEKVVIIGRISEEPDKRPDKTYLELSADSLIYRDLHAPISGIIMIRLAYPTGYFNISDRVILRGYLSTPIGARNPGTFSYREYLLTRGIRSFVSIKNRSDIQLISSGKSNLWLSGLIIPLRNYMLDVFDRYLTEPQSSLIAGFLIGETRFIPDKIYDDFRDTGTLHLLAVSGSNVALVIATFAFIMIVLRIPLRARYLISLLIILIFCNLSYNQPSVIRASVMIGLFILGRLAYRRVNYINIIAMAAVLILLFDPMMLRDVGFQLSFAAAFGLIYFLPIIFGRLSLKGNIFWKIGKVFLMTFLSTLVAQLAVAPILGANFNTIPTVGFAANLVVVPLASIAVIISLVMCLLGWLAPLGEIIGEIANLLLSLTISAVDFFGSIDLFELRMSSPPIYLVAVYYTTIILGFQVIRKPANLRYFLITLLLFANLILWKSLIEAADADTKIICMDAGNDIAVSLESSADSDILIASLNDKDCSNLTQWVLGPVLIEEGIGRLDGLITADSSDHSKLVDCLQEAGIDVENGIVRDHGSLYAHGQEGIADEQISYVLLHDNGRIVAILFDDYAIYDPGLAGEKRAVDILILPDPDAVEIEFVEKIISINPQVLVMAGYNHLYSAPGGYYRLEEGLREKGIEYFNTRLNGAVSIRYDSSYIDVRPTLAED